MADPKGDYLFVNLSATETRRRLKGFGHGVRKIQSAGKNRAAVIHTATGEHLAELEAKFADVGFAASAQDLSDPIENLRNIGPESARLLRGVGVTSIADLERLGPVVAFKLVRQRTPATSLNLLWSLAGGLRDCDWRDLPEAEKVRLRENLTDA